MYLIYQVSLCMRGRKIGQINQMIEVDIEDWGIK